jgi:tripartite-type tricarboxylate transporter receptor subunit TctC
MLVRMLLASLVCALALQAAAQEPQPFPQQPVKIVVPYPAGGGNDLIARMLAEQLKTKWNQTIVIENRAGVGGSVGAEFVARSRPDGATLLFCGPGPLGPNKYLTKQLGYEPSAFTPISVLGIAPNLLVVSDRVAARSVAELVAFARANPGRMSYASQGKGSTGHLTAAMFEQVAGIRLNHIPYRGTAPAVTDLTGGHVDMFFFDLSSYQGMTLRALAIANEKRSALLPELPTFGEAGFPSMLSATWYGFIAPPDTASEIVEKINRDVEDVLKMPAFRDEFVRRGNEVMGGSRGQARQFIAAENAKWKQVIEASGIVPE